MPEGIHSKSLPQNLYWSKVAVSVIPTVGHAKVETRQIDPLAHAQLLFSRVACSVLTALWESLKNCHVAAQMALEVMIGQTLRGPTGWTAAPRGVWHPTSINMTVGFPEFSLR